MKKKILIVNCCFDEFRYPVRRQTKIPQAMGPAFLAGAFSTNLCEIKLYNEQYSGPLENDRLLSFPDMLVLTGLNNAFDRMLHITAYVRTKSPKAIVVAGGPAIRALPCYSEPFFDYACTGDVEQLKDVIEDVFGQEYVSESLIKNGWVIPRYDLTYWMKFGRYVESSRNCYYKCSFCSLTSENREYQSYDTKYLSRQFQALGRKNKIIFIDNNFGGTNSQLLDDKFLLLKQLKHQGYLKDWIANVSEEFLSDENLTKASEAGCLGLFSGVESFDDKSIIKFKKFQNIRLPQVDAIKKCLNAGIVFTYGLVMDISSRTITELKNELEFILDTPEIPLPSYISIGIPILRTPYFYDCVSNNLLLPNIKLRDMDSTTLMLKPLDPIPDVVDFIKQIQHLTGYRKKIFRHAQKFYQLYKTKFKLNALPFLMSSPLLLCTPKLSTLGTNFITNGFKKHHRTFIGSTEPLDSVYKPAFPVDNRYTDYFNPTMLTDSRGYINEKLLTDLYENFSPFKQLAQ